MTDYWRLWDWDGSRSSVIIGVLVAKQYRNVDVLE